MARHTSRGTELFDTEDTDITFTVLAAEATIRVRDVEGLECHLQATAFSVHHLVAPVETRLN